MPRRIGNRLLTLAQVAGVLASAYLVWSDVVIPRLSRQSIASLCAEVLLYVVIAWICGGILTTFVYLVVSLADMPDAVRCSLRSSAPAMWFAPALILLSAPSPAAFPVSLVLIVSATRLLVSRWITIESPIPRLETPREMETGLFRGVDHGALLLGSSAMVLIASCMAQAGVVAMLWREPLVAALCLAISTAVLTSIYVTSDATRPDHLPTLPPSGLSIVATFLLAATISFGGIAVRIPAADATDASPAPAAKSAPFPDETAGLDGEFSGVILLPNVKSQATLLIPVAATPRTINGALPAPMAIPFFGEYWMYRPPRTRPPLRSFVRRGKPSELAFRTTDGAPLEMEAHQRLTGPMEISCCSGIELAITDAESQPSDLSLELILVDSQRGISENLGVHKISKSFAQTVRFAMPRRNAMRAFDEFIIVFHQDSLHSDKSARVAIERFVLTP